MGQCGVSREGGSRKGAEPPEVLQTLGCTQGKGQADTPAPLTSHPVRMAMGQVGPWSSGCQKVQDIGDG